MDSDLIINIRVASLSDAPMLTRLMRQAFAQAYASCTRPADLEAHMEANFTEERQRAELEKPQAATLLAKAHSQFIGYAQWTPGPPPACVRAKQTVQLQRLYVLKPYWGTGVAHRLMKSCLTYLSDSSYRTVWLSCWTQNERALEFYRKWGFRRSGTEPFFVGSDRQTDFILVRPVGELETEMPDG